MSKHKQRHEMSDDWQKAFLNYSEETEDFINISIDEMLQKPLETVILKAGKSTVNGSLEYNGKKITAEIGTPDYMLWVLQYAAEHAKQPWNKGAARFERAFRSAEVDVEDDRLKGRIEMRNQIFNVDVELNDDAMEWYHEIVFELLAEERAEN